MEAAKLDSGGTGERSGCGGTPVHHRIRTPISGARTPTVHRTKGAAGLRSGGIAGGRVVRSVDAFGVRRGGCVSEVEDALDVVACDWGAGDRARRPNLSASPWSGLRHNRRTVARKRNDKSDLGRAVSKVVHLGGIAGI